MGDRIPASERLKVTVGALAMLAAAIGLTQGGDYGGIAVVAGFSFVLMLVALTLASRFPRLTGAVPGLLGGMTAAVIGLGWRNPSSWIGLIGGITAILTWIMIERRGSRAKAAPA